MYDVIPNSFQRFWLSKIATFVFSTFIIIIYFLSIKLYSNSAEYSALKTVKYPNLAILFFEWFEGFEESRTSHNIYSTYDFCFVTRKANVYVEYIQISVLFIFINIINIWA